MKNCITSILDTRIKLSTFLSGIFVYLMALFLYSCTYVESQKPDPLPPAEPIVSTSSSTLNHFNVNFVFVEFTGLKYVKPPTSVAPTTTNWKYLVTDGVKFFEGFYPKPYICPAGHRTIGYGFTGATAKRSSISKGEASKMLEELLEKCRGQVDANVKVPLTEHQREALTSFTMNLGEDNLKLLVNGPGRLNSGNYDSVAKLLKLYVKADGQTLRGLEARREWEINVWKGNTQYSHPKPQ